MCLHFVLTVGKKILFDKKVLKIYSSELNNNFSQIDEKRSNSPLAKGC